MHLCVKECEKIIFKHDYNGIAHDNKSNAFKINFFRDLVVKTEIIFSIINTKYCNNNNNNNNKNPISIEQTRISWSKNTYCYRSLKSDK